MSRRPSSPERFSLPELKLEEEDENGIPAPSSRGPLGKLRKGLNSALAEEGASVNGHDEGHDDTSSHRDEDVEPGGVEPGGTGGDRAISRH